MDIELINHMITDMKQTKEKARLGHKDHIAQIEERLDDKELNNEETMTLIGNLIQAQIDYEDTVKLYDRRIKVAGEIKGWYENKNE